LTIYGFNNAIIYGVYVSQVHCMCVGLCGLGRLLFHVLSSLALLDLESDGVNDGALRFLGFIWWEVSSHLNSMNEKVFTHMIMKSGISVSKNG
jgi:hypothetical protein